MRVATWLAAAFVSAAVAAPGAPAQSAPAPSPAPAQGAPAWLGLTFDTPATALRKTLGDPLRVLRFPDVLAATGRPVPATSTVERRARYPLSLYSPVFLIVTERHGLVVGIEAEGEGTLDGVFPGVDPDPSGVALGAPEDDVVRAHPKAQKVTGDAGTQYFDPAGRRYVASYTIVAGRVRAIAWFTVPSTDPAVDGPPLAEPAGDSLATAILDGQRTEMNGVRWQRLYFQFHPCAGTTPWTRTSVALRREGASSYDVVHAGCAATGKQRDFYFDITPFFGKT
jgi:hypothetical protein